MEMSDLGLCELGAYECLCLKPYLDAVGVKTVGFGSTISDIPDLPLWSWNKEITIKEAVDIYRQGLKKYVAAVNKAVTRLEIPQNLFDALVSITYNIGVNGMAKSTFIKKVNEGASNEVIVKAMVQWNKGGGKVLKGLVNRRAKEAKLILTGEYSSKGYVPLAQVVNKKPQYSSSRLINLMEYL